jgi:hypothetical protein
MRVRVRLCMFVREHVCVCECVCVYAVQLRVRPYRGPCVVRSCVLVARCGVLFRIRCTG